MTELRKVWPLPESQVAASCGSGGLGHNQIDRTYPSFVDFEGIGLADPDVLIVLQLFQPKVKISLSFRLLGERFNFRFENDRKFGHRLHAAQLLHRDIHSDSTPNFDKYEILKT
jgi:hypothetical protein